MTIAVSNEVRINTEESNEIEVLLLENIESNISSDQLMQDSDQLKVLTSEIKSIGKQSTILMGERVYKARELLKPYKNGTFTRWLENTFGSKKSGYNALSFYELYMDLPNELQNRLEHLPKRAAYILASKNGPSEVKKEILTTHHDKNNDELISLIQEKFPVNKFVRKKSKNDKWIKIFVATAKKIKLNDLTDEEKKTLFYISDKIWQATRGNV